MQGLGGIMWVGGGGLGSHCRLLLSGASYAKVRRIGKGWVAILYFGYLGLTGHSDSWATRPAF